MPDYIRYGLVALIVLLTHVQEAITGFGCTVLALPFVTLLLGLDVAVPVLVFQAWVLVLYIVIVSRKNMVWKEYGHIVILMGLGLPVGIWMSQSMPEAQLKWVLAAFMVGIGIQGLVRQYRNIQMPSKISPKTRRLASLFIPLGGIIHGAFGSGGPLVVIYATRALTEKSLFRVTLCMVWLTVNTILLGQWVVMPLLDHRIATRITPEVLYLSALFLPFTVVGTLMGDKAHHRIDEDLFRKIVYFVLAAAGIVLAWSLILEVRGSA